MLRRVLRFYGHPRGGATSLRHARALRLEARSAPSDHRRGARSQKPKEPVGSDEEEEPEEPEEVVKFLLLKGFIKMLRQSCLLRCARRTSLSHAANKCRAWLSRARVACRSQQHILAVGRDGTLRQAR